ncbi:MAG: primosomal protein [Rhodococcus sp.]|nr:primosomal protein [Rhodococcus sp. (in: high G+C Gram-positive bacteria)]
MAGDIVPIELGLTDGDLFTLWAPRWREGDDEWEAFLGHEEDLYAFASVAELAAFVRVNTDNDLVDHPAWATIVKLSAVELEPDETFQFDLIGVPEIAAGDPESLVISELESTLAMVRNIGEVCELDAVIDFFDKNPVLDALASGEEAFVGRPGEELWDQIGTVIAEGWDDVLDAVDDVVSSPKVDADALAVAEAEIVAADENTVEVDDATDADDDDEFVPLHLGSDDDEIDDSFWTEVGVDPIKIVTSRGTFFTLRCYLGDDAIFLGRAPAITVFTSERALARYLADNHEHDLAKFSTYEQIQIAAVDGSLDVEVTDENVYVLTGLADDLADGPTAVDPDQLDLAVEVFSDAADYAGEDIVETALAPSTPLGWYVSFLLEPDPTRLAPNPPYDAEAESWRELERDFEARLVEGE